MFEVRDKYGKLFDLKTLGASQVDLPTGRFVRVNRTYCKMLGYSEAELLGLLERQVIRDQDWSGEEKPYRGAVAHEFQGPVRYLHKSGVHVWLEQTLILYDEASRFALYKVVDAGPLADARHASSRCKLSEEEHRILTFMSKGWSNRAIATELDLSLSAVKHYARTIYSKLGVKSWIEAVAWAHKNGLVPLDRLPTRTLCDDF